MGCVGRHREFMICPCHCSQTLVHIYTLLTFLLSFACSWGKHNPPITHRGKNVARAWGKGVTQTDFFPVVLIKDPYSWMGSQCRHKYTSFWGHDENHCPNLIRWRVPDRDETASVRVKYALEWRT